MAKTNSLILLLSIEVNNIIVSICGVYIKYWWICNVPKVQIFLMDFKGLKMDGNKSPDTAVRLDQVFRTWSDHFSFWLTLNKRPNTGSTLSIVYFMQHGIDLACGICAVPTTLINLCTPVSSKSVALCNFGWNLTLSDWIAWRQAGMDRGVSPWSENVLLLIKPFWEYMFKGWWKRAMSLTTVKLLSTGLPEPRFN